MTDLELATLFFERIKSKGFVINFNTEAYGETKESSDHYTVIELYSSENKPFVEFDFYPDGAFHRISGFTNGYWQDEVDWKKY